MKFFSNEKETDTQDPDRTDHVASEPVTVPPQRAGSPWSDAPRDTNDPVDVPLDTDPPRSSSGDTSTDEPATTTTYGPDGSVVDDKDYRGTHEFGDSADRPASDVRDTTPDVGDTTPDIGDTTFDKASDDVDTTPENVDKASENGAIKDEGTFDSPEAVEPVTGEPIEAKDEPATDDAKADDIAHAYADRPQDSEDFQPATDSPAVVEPEPVVAATAATTSTDSATGAKLLPDGDSFAERFRDIQLRFVDEPKEATAEAATLVGDAVDKLTGALKAQRDGLAGNSDDTEKLRVELRAYRDILNRLLAL